MAWLEVTLRLLRDTPGMLSFHSVVSTTNSQDRSLDAGTPSLDAGTPSPIFSHTVIIPSHPVKLAPQRGDRPSLSPQVWCVRQNREVPQLLDFKLAFLEEVTSHLPHPPLVSSDTV